MCDNDSINDIIDYKLRTGGLSRRKFSALTLGVGVASALPPIANAAETKESDVEIKTADGTADYCMGGPLVFETAAAVPDRVGAAATFHGGGLVTDKPDSPHLLIPKMKASYLLAIAENDDQKQPDAKNVLRDSFAKAKLPAEIEVYKGTIHGWCPPDSQVFNQEQAEKAWGRLLVLFKAALA